MNTPAFPIRRLLIAVVPSVSILLLAYLLYSYHRHAFSDYQSSRSFRALNQMENQIKSKLDALEEVIINSGDSAEGKEYLESLHLFTRVDDLTADQVEFRPLKPEGKLVAWRANLQDIFGPLARLDLFESVVIARQDGTVLAQKSSTLVRFADLHSSIQERITGDKKAKSRHRRS
jgi:hypothetical protein